MDFSEYLRAGWKLCAVPAGTKGPNTKGWNQLVYSISDPAVRIPFGAGLCHAWSGTCAIDVDNYEVARDWLLERGINLDELLMARDSVQISSGRQGRAKLIYALPEILASTKIAPYQVYDQATNKQKTYHALEFRCATADGLTVQDVLPPSIHPTTGMPYEWRYGDEIFGSWQNLPQLPEALRALWEAQLAPTSPIPVGPIATLGAQFDEIRSLLDARDPDCPYDEWLKVGLAVHHETRGSREGLSIWDEWSRKGAKYGVSTDGKPPQFPADKWRTFRYDPNNPITLGWLRAEAVARPEEFPTVEAEAAAAPVVTEFGVTTPGQGTDTRPDSIMKALLEPRLVFVAGQDNYYDLAAKGEAWLSDRSVQHMFCPYMPTIVLEGKNGKPDKHIQPNPVEYMKNSKTKLIVDAVGMHPGEGRLYEEGDRRWVNRYVPRKIEPLRPKPHEMEAFNFLWDRMKDPVFQRWLKAFFAHAVQKPGVKIRSAPLLFSGETGTGKNTIMKTLPERLFGTRWVRGMSGDILNSQFSDVLGETWWLYLEELRTGSTKAERVLIGNKMKTWITDSSFPVHPKGMKPYDMFNRIQLTATSNFDDAIQLDNNDRRWAVSELTHVLSEREVIDLYAWLDDPRTPGVLHHIFRSVNLTGFNPNGRAPDTVDKKVMIRAGIGSWESMLVEKMVAQEYPFNRDCFQLKTVHEQIVGKGPSSPQMLASMLRKAPFHCAPLANHNSTRLWAWRNVDRWKRASSGERAKHMETGERPNRGYWSNEIPASILAMSAEEHDDPSNELLIPEGCEDLI